jgi:hypothetical protein
MKKDFKKEGRKEGGCGNRLRKTWRSMLFSRKNKKT